MFSVLVPSHHPAHIKSCVTDQLCLAGHVEVLSLSVLVHRSSFVNVRIPQWLKLLYLRSAGFPPGWKVRDYLEKSSGYGSQGTFLFLQMCRNCFELSGDCIVKLTNVMILIWKMLWLISLSFLFTKKKPTKWSAKFMFSSGKKSDFFSSNILWEPWSIWFIPGKWATMISSCHALEDWHI